MTCKMGIAGLYDMEETLGKGHFAVVKSARHVFTGLRVAIKVIDKDKLDDVAKAHLFQEVRCMKLVTHPNIVRLYEVIDTPSKLYLILELGDGGDMYDFIMKHEKGIEEDLARDIFKQVVNAIDYCHRLHVVHRDLKPENLVFCNSSHQPRVKLTDFGLSRSFMPGQMLESSVGSLEYSAPEILLGDQYHGPSIDIWSLGVILYMLMVGRSPFSYGNPSETLTNIMDGKYETPSSMSIVCKDLISRMLVVDTEKRATIAEIKRHPWLMDCVDDAPSPLLNPLEISDDDHNYIVDKMVSGNFGTKEEIIKTIKESPYSSISATYFLLTEAELHRRVMRGGSTINPQQECLRRKLSVPDNRMIYGLSPRTTKGILDTPEKSRNLSNGFGSAERGVLRPRRPTQCAFVSLARESPNSSPSVLRQLDSSPLTEGPLWNGPKSAFPLALASNDTESQIVSADPESVFPKVLIQRKLSAFEEEDEETASPFGSRANSPAIRRSPLMNQSPISPARQPSNSRANKNAPVANLHAHRNSFSKSDGSDEACSSSGEDDMVHLLTSSGQKRNHISSRLLDRSPVPSPHIPRRSPSHTWGFQSDDEGRKKSRNARSSSTFRRKLRNLRRVESSNSDDSFFFESQLSNKSISKNGVSNRQRAHSMEIDDCISTDQLRGMMTKLKGRISRESSNGSNDINTEHNIDLTALRHQAVTSFELSDEEDGGSDQEMEIECSQNSKKNGRVIKPINGKIPTRHSFSGLTEKQKQLKLQSDIISIKSDTTTSRSAYCSLV